jgi:short-subunit dehydrogenase
MDLAGRCALLTGASGGLGNAIARGLVRQGAVVIATGRRKDALENLREELGERIEVDVCDLSRAEEVDRLAERAREADVLVANAALPGSGKLEGYDPEDIDRALAVNLRAPIQLTRTLLPGMRERGLGHLVYISSLSGKVATGGSSIYSATKFGLRGFAFALHEELYETEIGVTTVFPGFIKEAGMWAESGTKLPPGIREKRPHDVARAVIRGIERGKPEIDVAPLTLRSMAKLAGPAPRLVSAVGRRLGAADVADRLEESQRSKR